MHMARYVTIGITETASPFPQIAPKDGADDEVIPLQHVGKRGRFRDGNKLV